MRVRTCSSLESCSTTSRPLHKDEAGSDLRKWEDFYQGRKGRRLV